MKIENLASKIIFESLNEQNDDDDGDDNLGLEDQPGTKQVYKLLTYLWGVARGLGKVTPLESVGEYPKRSNDSVRNSRLTREHT
jgi:hypothetical protein